MKINNTLLIVALALTAPAFTLLAKPQGDRVKGEGKRHRSPLVAALDTNGDGVIDAQEIANAPAALKTLDKNGDGQLTRDEYQPKRPKVDAPQGTKNSPAPTPAATP